MGSAKKSPRYKPYLKAVTVTKPPESARIHPFDIPALRNLNEIEFHNDVTFFVGENGSGKSTVLEAIAIVMKLGAQGGTGNIYIDDDSDHGISALHRHMRPHCGIQSPRDRFFLRAETLYNVGTWLEKLAKDPDAHTSEAQVFARYGGKSLHRQSHGESFLSLLVDSLSGEGFYLLDEPEAALSPSRQLAALIRINQLVDKQSQFIIATHSPILMAYPRAKIILFDREGCREIGYEETEHFRITRDFLNHYEGRLARLLAPDDV